VLAYAFWGDFWVVFGRVGMVKVKFMIIFGRFGMFKVKF
jgi:hypothetical protein